jgi:steroid 5-alpha reductase family enzyme
MVNPYVDAALLVLIYMVCWFGVAIAKKNNSLVDIAWGLGFIVVFWSLFFLYYRSLLLGLMVTAWGLRLSIHIFFRNWWAAEDWRYRQWREEWGKNWLIRTLLQVFILQGFFLWVIALPLINESQHTDNQFFILIKLIGFLVWLTGFLWEAIADWQLRVFKSQVFNKGKIFTGGLWKLSRHPNYFGEIVLWWGIFTFTLPSDMWWLSTLSPLTITWLLHKVSGVPMLERKYLGNPDYQAYIKKTPALFPKLKG